MIDMFGDVTVTHQDGTRFVTASARVNAARTRPRATTRLPGTVPRAK